MVHIACDRVDIEVIARKETFIDSNSHKLPNDLIKHVKSNVCIDIVLS